MKKIMEEGVDMDDPFENWYQGTVKTVVRKKKQLRFYLMIPVSAYTDMRRTLFLSDFYPIKAFMVAEEADELEE